MKIPEKYRLDFTPNKVIATLGGLTCTAGTVFLLWGGETYAHARGQESNNTRYCNWGNMAACEQIANNLYDENVNGALALNGGALALLGGGIALFAYARDKRPLTPTLVKLPFETEYEMIVANELPLASGINAELPPQS